MALHIRRMYLAYFDESGDSGLTNSPTKFFVLSCVLVHESHWMASLDALIRLRSLLREHYGIRARPEIKATDLRRGRGALAPLRMSLAQRMKIFRGLMKFQRVYLPNITVFAVAIEKAAAAPKGYEPREAAWTFAMERVDRFCRPQNERVMLFPDEGHSSFIRKLLRRKRRYATVPGRFGGTLSIPTERIVEDPNSRHSHDSYFVQVADWNAFAAHRSSYIDPMPSVETGLWDLLGERRLLAVNSIAGGPPGIMLFP